jgi:hypothetical protein
MAKPCSAWTRELTRARDAARADLTRKRQQVSSMLLRLGRHYPGIKTWNARHRSWLANLRLDHPEQRFALEEMLQAERQAGERIGRLEQAIREALADWSLAPVHLWSIEGESGPAMLPGKPAFVQRWGRGHGRGTLVNTTWPILAITLKACLRTRRPHLDRGSPGRTNGHAVSNPRIRA